MTGGKPETDTERLARIKRTGLVRASGDILAQVRNAPPLTDAEIRCLLGTVTSEISPKRRER